MTSRAQARDSMFSHVLNAWESHSETIPLFFEDVTPLPPNGEPFGRVMTRHTSSPRRSIGTSTIYETNGQLYIDVFTTLGDGMQVADAVCQALMNALRTQPADGCVRFYSPFAREVREDGAYFQTNVRCDFQYDEVSP